MEVFNPDSTAGAEPTVGWLRPDLQIEVWCFFAFLVSESRLTLTSDMASAETIEAPPTGHEGQSMQQDQLQWVPVGPH